MKSTKLFFFLCLLALGLRDVLQAQTPPLNGLVAYYPFNGNAIEQTGTGNNGTVNNAVLTFDRTGSPNSAYAFNGNDSVITFSTVPLNQVDNWTLSAWINPASLNQLGMAVVVGQDTGSSGNGFGFGIAGGWPVSGSNLFGVFGSVGAVDSGYSFPATNRWYQVTMLRDAGVLKFFVNGAQTPTTVTGAPIMPTDFRIGSQTGIRFFKGSIDDVRIYNRALSAAEVQQLYLNESLPCVTRHATATATVINGFVVGIDLLDGGCGYTNAPLVNIINGGGTGATAVASVQNGSVVRLTVTSAGIGYTNTPTVVIASPPFLPWLSIGVSAVKVTMHVLLGNNYLLESSTDFSYWTPVGTKFTAQSEVITQECELDVTGRFFRVRQVP